MAVESLEPGTIIYDNDPRHNGRTVGVLRTDGSTVICRGKGRDVRIRLDRIHTDGKPRHQGFSTIAPAPAVAD